MPQVLAMSNGTPETILSPKDFEDLIDKYITEEVEEVLKVNGY